ncbi:uncharacterized protein LOC134824371 [Bolinopsis microptera]|uniref:uncharacterized protein LOC134824371 n=1 Tax=Bolinopsis microptera TaxID=2820187 RepID=UPI00307A0351
MSWNVDAPEFVPGRRFVPQTTPTTPPNESPPKEVHLSSRSRDPSRDPCHVSRVTNGEPSSSSSSSGMVSSLRYSDVTALHSDGGEAADVQSEVVEGEPGSSGELCPYYLETGTCSEDEMCVNIHGLLCEHCSRYCLPPNNPKLQKCHEDICAEIKSYKKAAEASKELTCAICFEVVLEKEDKKQRKFGLLSECWHTFCIECIRRWRASQSKDQTKRNCPICRKISYFIVPSEVWVADPAEKDRLVQGYKEHLSTKDCMHFNKGRDHCPFGANCFYKHALPDGTIVPDNVVKRRVNSQGDQVVVSMPLISDFLEELLTYSAANTHHLNALRTLFQELNNHP